MRPWLWPLPFARAPVGVKEPLNDLPGHWGSGFNYHCIPGAGHLHKSLRNRTHAPSRGTDLICFVWQKANKKMRRKCISSEASLMHHPFYPLATFQRSTLSLTSPIILNQGLLHQRQKKLSLWTRVEEKSGCSALQKEQQDQQRRQSPLGPPAQITLGVRTTSRCHNKQGLLLTRGRRFELDFSCS